MKDEPIDPEMQAFLKRSIFCGLVMSAVSFAIVGVALLLK